MQYYEHLRANHAILIIQHTSWNSLSSDGPTDGPTDMGNYRAAIAAKNNLDVHGGQTYFFKATNDDFEVFF